jgi:hypothetical protein
MRTTPSDVTLEEPRTSCTCPVTSLPRQLYHLTSSDGRYISKELCSKSQYHHKSENNDHLKTTDYQRQSELVSRAVISVYFLSYFLNYDYTYHMTKLKISHFSNVIAFCWVVQTKRVEKSRTRDFNFENVHKYKYKNSD